MSKKLISLMPVLALLLATMASAGIVYVDATEGDPNDPSVGNTILATGEVFTSVEDQSGADNLWRGRVFANEGTIFESGGQFGDTANPEDCPRLLTSVAVPSGHYRAYAYIWADGSQWRIQASLANSEGDLPLYLANDPNSDVLQAVAEDFEEPVPLLAEGNRTLWQINLGLTGRTSSIDVYIDDDPNHQTHNGRTWYDGIGYEAVEPSVPFSVGAYGDITLDNGPRYGQEGSGNGSGIEARDVADRRHVFLVSYDISGLKARGETANVSFSHFSHDLGDATNVYGILEDVDLLDVESLTWATAPGTQNDPLPELNTTVTAALDMNDLSDVLLTFEGPGSAGIRYSTDTSEALADFINSDTDGILTFLFAPAAEGNQLINRSREHSAGGTLLQGSTAPLGTVAWVTESQDVDLDGVQDDIGFTDLLSGAGYDLDNRPNNWTELDADKIAELEAADLVMVSRSTSSGNYDDGNEISEWNGLSTPLILMSAHINRNNRWRFFDSADLLALIPGATEVLDTGHPMFDGLALDEANMIQLHDPNVGSGQSNFTLAADAGNGTVLALGDGLISIAEWAAGVEYYTGAEQWAGGTRMYITVGTQETRDPGTETPQGAMNLNEAGQQALLNAVDYMIPLEPVDPGTDNLRHHYSFEGDATDDVAGANGTLEGGAVIADGALLTTAQDQYLSLPGETIAINTYDEVTLSAWYTPEAGGNTSWSMLAYFGGTENDLGGNGLFITAARGDDVSRAAISVGNVDTPWSSESGANGPEYDDGLLHHMVGTFNGDVVLYLDGAETGRTATSETNVLSGIATTFSALAKGGYGGDPEWIGQIHEFSIYDRALSPAEVLFLYNQGPN